jgi:GMP synthase (glutamine-hydrolysing)
MSVIWRAEYNVENGNLPKIFLFVEAIMIFGLYHSVGETVGLMGDVIKQLHLPFKEVHLYEGEGLPRDVSDLEGLVVMGGPMNVDEIDKYPFLLPELQLMEKVLSEKKPIIGICLGAQLIAKALGQRVYPHHTREVGWYPIQMTSRAQTDAHFNLFPNEINVLHWHGDTFDIPNGAVHLATSKICENQAFRWGANTYALQFHFEVTPHMLEGWCKAKCEQEFIASAGQDPKKIIEATSKAFQILEPLAKKFFTSYFKQTYSHLLTPA